MTMPSPHRRLSRAVLFIAVALLPATIAPPASASTVTYTGSCGLSVDVVQWTPQKGAVARFVADTYASSNNTGLWIGLGRTSTAFWSAEGNDPNDACDECRTLSLVETKFDGTRTRHAVLTQQDHQRLGSDPVAEKAHVLATLWKLAAGAWPATTLKQDYRLSTGKPPANAPSGNPSFVAEVAVKGSGEIRYDLKASTSMCWCIYDWKAKGTPATASTP